MPEVIKTLTRWSRRREVLQLILRLTRGRGGGGQRSELPDWFTASMVQRAASPLHATDDLVMDPLLTAWNSVTDALT